MANGDRSKKPRLYLSVDVGGTKIQASLVEESGVIQARERDSTPRGGGPELAVAAIERIVEKIVKAKGIAVGELSAMGLAIPGVVDPEEGRIVFTANMALTGVEIVSHLEARFGVPIALGNDCNLGALGETWLGSARRASSAVSLSRNARRTACSSRSSCRRYPSRAAPWASTSGSAPKTTKRKAPAGGAGGASRSTRRSMP